MQKYLGNVAWASYSYYCRSTLDVSQSKWNRRELCQQSRLLISAKVRRGF